MIGMDVVGVGEAGLEGVQGLGHGKQAQDRGCRKASRPQRQAGQAMAAEPCRVGSQPGCADDACSGLQDRLP